MFTDTSGAGWQVWAVQPPSPDRRAGDDRRGAAASDPWYERRRGAERRVRDVGRPPAVAGPLANGWLCFEAVGSEGTVPRRRLAPIPPAWVECPETALRGFLEQAAPVVPRSRSA